MPPTDAEIEEATGARVLSRTRFRSNGVSTVETADLVAGHGPQRRVFIKTSRPLLTHEATACRLVSNCDMEIPSLLAAGTTEQGDPWLVSAAVEGSRLLPTAEEDLSKALSGVVSVHAEFLGADLTAHGVPSWDVTWLASEAPKTCATIRGEVPAGGMPSHLTSYADRLAELAESFTGGLTLVHGDFDPGNLLVRSDGQVVVMDWGLSHCSSPLVDLAHLLEHVEEPVRSRLAAPYLADLPDYRGMSPSQAIHLGGLMHRAFFVWWHTRLIDNAWATWADHGDVICQRIAYVNGTD